VRWLASQPSLAAVLGLNLAWLLVALASSEARPFGQHVWGADEESPVERLELALIVVYDALWLLIGWRLRRAPQGGLPRMLSLAMVGQLVLMMSEEMDWCSSLGFHHRNLRQASRTIFPGIMDTPMMAAFLLCFLFVPLIPLAATRAWLDRASPVRAERADAWAVIAGMIGSVIVWALAGDQKLGELQQMVVYMVLGVITLRVVRKTGAA